MRHARWIASAVVLALTMIAAPTIASAQDERSGVEIWAQTCGNCHQNQTGSRYTAEKWRSIMAHMRILARLTDSEAEAILAFLTRGDRDREEGSQAQPADSTSGGGEKSETKKPTKPKKPNNEPGPPAAGARL